MMKIVKESQVQQEKFRTAANKLLNNCFILKKKDSTHNDYVFITQHKSMFDEYFDLLGYKLEVYEDYGFIALSSASGTGRLRLKKIESIILLILRLLYIEKRKELSLIEDVIIFSEDIYQKYGMLNIEAKPNLDKTTLKETTRLFRKYNIISIIDREVTMPDARIKIYPTVMFAVSSDNLNGLYDQINEKLNQYVSGGESNDDEEISED